MVSWCMVAAMHPKGKLRCRIAAAPAVAGRERMRERERRYEAGS